MADALAAAMHVGEVALWWYGVTSAVAVGAVIAGFALGKHRRG